MNSGVWKGLETQTAPGGEGNGRALEREAVPIDQLCEEAPKRAFQMLQTLAAEGKFAVDFSVAEGVFVERFGELGVSKAELLALRLYTGPCFELYNTVLRAKAGKLPAGPGYPRKAGDTDGNTGGKFVTTIHAVTSGIIKLSKITPMGTVYRGTTGRVLPARLREADDFGVKLGVEFGLVCRQPHTLGCNIPWTHPPPISQHELTAMRCLGV